MSKAWQREWNVMKDHCREFCGQERRGGQMEAMGVQPRTPRGRMERGTEAAADRRYLAACRGMKKVAKEDFARLGAYFNAPQGFVPYAGCVAALLTGVAMPPSAAWRLVSPMLTPSDDLVSSLLTFDPTTLPPDSMEAVTALPNLNQQGLRLESPAALAIAVWCHAVREYNEYLETTGGSAVVPGVAKTVSCNGLNGPSKPLFMIAASPKNMTSHRSVSLNRSPSAQRRSRSIKRSTPKLEEPVVAEVERPSRVRPVNTPPTPVTPATPYVQPVSVLSWLSSLGLSAFARVFLDNEIDIETVPLLKEPDLDDMGLPLGPKLRILASVHSMQGTNVLG